MRIQAATTISLFVALPLFGGPVTAQDEMPFEAYVEALVAYGADSAARTEANASEVFPTVEESLASMDASVPFLEAEVKRLTDIVPEDCYREAHEEILAYQEDGLAILRDIRPQLEQAETVMGMLPYLMAVGAELEGRHPAAYVEDSSSTTGTSGHLLNIIPALATCAGADEVGPAPMDDGETPITAETSAGGTAISSAEPEHITPEDGAILAKLEPGAVRRIEGAQQWLDYVRDMDDVLQTIGFGVIGQGAVPLERQRLWIPTVIYLIEEAQGLDVDVANACLTPAVATWRASLDDVHRFLLQHAEMLESRTVTVEDVGPSLRTITQEYLNLYFWNAVVWPEMDACRSAGDLEY